jgi:hypothetical protein
LQTTIQGAKQDWKIIPAEQVEMHSLDFNQMSRSPMGANFAIFRIRLPRSPGKLTQASMFRGIAEIARQGRDNRARLAVGAVRPQGRLPIGLQRALAVFDGQAPTSRARCSISSTTPGSDRSGVASPCRRAFKRAAAFPAAVRGPVLRVELRRLASRCRELVISDQP